MRDSDALKSLAVDVKKWYEADFGRDFSYETVKVQLENMCENKIREFLFKRLGHLNCKDLFNLRDIISGKKGKV